MEYSREFERNKTKTFFFGFHRSLDSHNYRVKLDTFTSEGGLKLHFGDLLHEKRNSVQSQLFTNQVDKR